MATSDPNENAADRGREAARDEFFAEAQEAQGPPDAAAPAADASDAELARLRSELEQAKDLMLRSRADLDNYQKRVSRQMEDERKYALMPLLRDLLPVLDNVDRAIEAAEKTADVQALRDGFQMVAEQLERVLARHHCTPIEALHQAFDPHRHQAILQQPSADHPANTVIQVVQRGFQLHDRVVRPSQVIVSSGGENKPDAGAGREKQSPSPSGRGPG